LLGVVALEENRKAPERSKSWEPGIVVFCCREYRCTGVEEAAYSGYQAPCRVRMVQVPCASRVSEYMIMSALRSGADGILVIGGSADGCQSAKERAGDRRRFVLLANLLEFIGIEPGRVQICWESASAGKPLKVLVESFTEKVKALGPATKLVKELSPLQVVE